MQDPTYAKTEKIRKAVELCGSHEGACCAPAWPVRPPRRWAAWRPAAAFRPARPDATWSCGTERWVSPKVVQDAKARYDSAVNLQAIQIGGYYRGSKLMTTMTGRAHIPDIAGL